MEWLNSHALCALCVSVVPPGLFRQFLPCILLLLALAAASGCERAADAVAATSSNVLVIGSAGNQPGKFVKCRAMDVDKDGSIYVLDRTGRLQVFDPDGKYLRGWEMPDVLKGTPEDVEVDRDGNLVITDTHYARILVYSPQGLLLRQWGAWGKGPGQFIYPVGAAVDAANNVYVAEYGGNDRIQKFDAQGNFLLEWGSLGEGPGQFQRPEDLCIDDQGRVYVADSCNHRIQVFTADGKLLTSWGTVGDEPGQFRYPYDIVTDGSRFLYVCEYGNHRVQQFTLDGKPVRSWGRVGLAVGECNFPWDIALDRKGFLYVTDSMNNRVQRFRFE